MIRFNLKLAIRNLAKMKVYTMLIIGGFAIGFDLYPYRFLLLYRDKRQ